MQIHDKHSNLPKNLQIPFLFIDPVLDIFKDPCDSKTRKLDSIEKIRFQEYTDE